MIKVIILIIQRCFKGASRRSSSLYISSEIAYLFGSIFATCINWYVTSFSRHFSAISFHSMGLTQRNVYLLVAFNFNFGFSYPSIIRSHNHSIAISWEKLYLNIPGISRTVFHRSLITALLTPYPMFLRVVAVVAVIIIVCCFDILLLWSIFFVVNFFTKKAKF